MMMMSKKNNETIKNILKHKYLKNTQFYYSLFKYE